MKSKPNARANGFALPTALLILLLISTISFGLILVINTEGRVNGTDLDNTRAYYAAEAAMEKMVVDVNRLYSENQSPNVAQIEALAADRPDLDGADFSDYRITVPQVGGKPDVETRLITEGPFQDMIAQILPIQLTATASGFLGSEVRMSRDVQIVQIPVFQFGIFSEDNLSYFPGPNFDFGGRVHSNGNLYLSTSAELVFHSRLTAAGEIIRAELSNGLSTTATGRTGPILIPTAPGGCDNARPGCRDLQEVEGSKVGGPASTDNPLWENLSTSVYNGFILSQTTGARRLELPFASEGQPPVELLRKPPPAEDPTSVTAKSRLYNQAQIRILLADDPTDLPGPGVRLANVPPYATGSPILPVYAGGTPFAEGQAVLGTHQVRPPGVASGDPWPLIDGYILIQARQGGSFVDVTMEWLGLGITRGTPNAILQFQTHSSLTGVIPFLDISNPFKFYPLNFYDAREGEVRDVNRGDDNPSCAIGGIMNAINLDVGNLSTWLRGGSGTSGAGVDSETNNGYLLYFSDRRGGAGLRGGYNFEDIVNPDDSSGAPNATLDSAEDVNANGILDRSGADHLGDAFGLANGDPTLRVDCTTLGLENRVSGPRHALKLINGALGQIPTKPDGTGGFTVGSENPVYVQGNYNATTSGFGDPHAAAAVIADAVTLLSNSWDERSSMEDATYVGGGTSRRATETSYRLAVAAGKNMSWPHPSWTSAEDYGLDGGTHNFLRYIENWSGSTLHYRGSMVSLYYSQYAVGIYKCCNAVYSPPTRDYDFDTDFLRPEDLPPATPRFRDVNNLAFRQILSPD